MGPETIYTMAVRDIERTNEMRTYINLETQQIRVILEMLAEISLSRDLTKSEQYIHTSLLDALDRSLRGM